MLVKDTRSDNPQLESVIDPLAMFDNAWTTWLTRPHARKFSMTWPLPGPARKSLTC